MKKFVPIVVIKEIGEFEKSKCIIKKLMDLLLLKSYNK